MDTAIELRGTMVLIHPDLTKDPAGKSGEIGVITGYEPENDNVYVGFEANEPYLLTNDPLDLSLVVCAPPLQVGKPDHTDMVLPVYRVMRQIRMDQYNLVF